MEDNKETKVTDFLATLLQESSHKYERKITNRIDNLVNTLAYKHEIKALEDIVHLLKIRVEAADYIQKENDKRHSEVVAKIKEKTDFGYYLK